MSTSGGNSIFLHTNLKMQPSYHPLSDEDGFVFIVLLQYVFLHVDIYIIKSRNFYKQQSKLCLWMK